MGENMSCFAPSPKKNTVKREGVGMGLGGGEGGREVECKEGAQSEEKGNRTSIRSLGHVHCSPNNSRMWARDVL